MLFKLFLPKFPIDSESKWLPLMGILIENGFFSAVELVIQQFPSLDLNVGDENGNTVLHYVVEVNHPNDSHLKILKLLVSSPNININCRNNENYTPYECAWCNSTITTLKFLQTLPNCEPLTINFSV